MPNQLGNCCNYGDLALFKCPKSSLQQQLFDFFKQAIENGLMLPGELVPSTRELSKRLGLSRVTVLSTYNRLIEQGYLESKQSFGTFVRSTISQSSPEVRRIDLSAPLNPKTLSHYTRRVIEQPLDTSSSANQPTLNFGLAPTELLPIRKWKQFLSKAISEVTGAESLDALGDISLRVAIADYLRRSRSLVCCAQQIAVFSNSQSALALLAQFLLNEKDVAILEEPGFGAARQIFTAHGATLQTISVDTHGAVVNELKQNPAGFAVHPKLLYLTPSHQDPTGAILSLERRKQLVEWNRSAKAWIIEDDIDCEYRTGSSFTPTLMSLDDSSRVIYINSLWRTLYPLSSVCFVVLPPGLAEAFAQLKMLEHRCTSPVEQRAAAYFIGTGSLEQQIRQTSQIYSARKRALISALTNEFGLRITISKHSGALNQLVRFNLDCDENIISTCATDAGLKMISTKDYYIKESTTSEFLVSFGHTEEEASARAVSQFARLVSQHSAHGGGIAWSANSQSLNSQ